MGSEEATGGGNLTAPLLAQQLGGGDGTFGGDAFIGLVSAVAFATILAVVAGLLVSASGAISHDLWFNVLRPNTPTADREGTGVARAAALVVGVVAVVLTIALGDSLNVALLVGLALSIAASANFPALVLCMSWRRFNTVGAVTGIIGGLVASVLLIVLGPYVWPGGPESAPFPLTFPVLVSIPFGFACCWLGTMCEPASPGGRRRPTTNCLCDPKQVSARRRAIRTDRTGLRRGPSALLEAGNTPTQETTMSENISDRISYSLTDRVSHIELTHSQALNRLDKQNRSCPAYRCGCKNRTEDM